MVAFAAETFDPWAREAKALSKELKRRLVEKSGDKRAGPTCANALAWQYNEIEEDADLPNKSCDECQLRVCSFYDFKNMILESHNTLAQKTLLIVKNIDEEVDVNNLDTENEMGIVSSLEEAEIVAVNLDKEQDRCENINSQCVQQEYEFPTKKQRREYPTLAEALNNNQCLLCLEQFTEKQPLKSHIDSHVTGTLFDPYYRVSDIDIFCRHCKKTFEYRFKYIEHQRVQLNMKPFVCKHEGCGMSFHARSAFMQHKPIHGQRQFACATCAQSFKRKSELRLHGFIHEDAGRVYTCQVCGKQCKNRLTHTMHYKMHFKKPRHKCTKCSKQYYSLSELRRHSLSHSEQKPFQCATCSRSYFSKSSYVRHLRETCDWNSHSSKGLQRLDQKDK